ncbi:DNA (cytosine-5-)-methyltransferase [Peribacillus frigoritolerans]|uniref:DNA (cytosine-5-)-methyltransferase n=1 Tax=Peribacillus frigoritolerans TaxID=450367 RepID=UPI002E24654E|nr:DNA (cytosine-5-)-methyltransferase [Peribacillus frigoritolerans]MED4634702.1 DNA (cytosine-5-)-methyltransferase [Peribacillus frigoritolerans]
MKAISLFSSAGIGETYFKDLGIEIVTANELVERRANLYRSVHKKTKMIQGDISNKEIFTKIIESSPDKIDFMLASPPCQGLSVAGKNRNIESMTNDERNYLIYKVIAAIQILEPTYVLIENVSTLLKLLLLYNGDLLTVKDILFKEFNDKYNIEAEIVDAADLGVPQKRKRAIIKLFKKGTQWPWPPKEKKITVRETIGHLPSLEAGERSDIKWHFARKHDERHVLWMKHTPTGMSAFQNEVFYPKKEDGNRVKGYITTYRRILWDEPAPTITIRNDAISSQRNVHPGRRLKDGTYSDARVLTPLELMLLNSLPNDWAIPDDTPEILIRQCIGESIAPLMLKKIVGEIYK